MLKPKEALILRDHGTVILSRTVMNYFTHKILMKLQNILVNCAIFQVSTWIMKIQVIRNMEKRKIVRTILTSMHMNMKKTKRLNNKIKNY